MYNTCVIKNIDNETQTVLGVELSVNEEYTIPDSKRIAIASNDGILSKISTGIFQIGNGVEFFSSINLQIDHLKNNITPEVSSTSYPFASKTLPDGKKLFGRAHGKSFSLSAGANTIDFDIPYASCKITGVEIVGGEIGDTLDFFVLDDDSGTYSTVPNYVLNQFGFDVGVAKDFYRRESDYDADLYYDMCVSIAYYSQSAKTVYINYILHEVKD